MKSGMKIGGLILLLGAMTALGGCVYPPGYYQRTGVVYGDGGGQYYGGNVGGNAAVDAQDQDDAGYAYPADVGYGYAYDPWPWYGYGFGPTIGLGFYGGYWGGGRGYRGPWRGGGHYGHGGWGGHGGYHGSSGHSSGGHSSGGHH